MELFSIRIQRTFQLVSTQQEQGGTKGGHFRGDGQPAYRPQSVAAGHENL